MTPEEEKKKEEKSLAEAISNNETAADNGGTGMLDAVSNGETPAAQVPGSQVPEAETPAEGAAVAPSTVDNSMLKAMGAVENKPVNNSEVSMTKAISDGESGVKDSEDAPSASSTEVTNSYIKALEESGRTNDKAMETLISKLESERKAYEEQEASRQKGENRMQIFGGLTEAAAAIANLVGTAHHASNQQQKYQTADWMKIANERRARSEEKMRGIRQSLAELQRQRTIQQAQDKLKVEEARQAEQIRRDTARIAAEKAVWERQKDAAELGIKRFTAEANASNNKRKTDSSIELNEAKIRDLSIRQGIANKNAETSKQRADDAKAHNEAMEKAKEKELEIKRSQADSNGASSTESSGESAAVQARKRIEAKHNKK